MRIAAKPGKTKEAIEAFKKTFKIYPLADAKNPKPTEFVNLSNKKYNTIHANDASFYDEINEVIQYEPASVWDSELVGLAGAIGIKKGHEFKPDERMKNVLTEASTIGNAYARTVLFMVYDNQTRSILETDQKTGGLDSNSEGVKLHDDGSATVYFGPKPPEGHEGNWVQTMPGKGYNVLLRLYGPLEPWFEKTWMPGDFEPVE